MSASEKALAQQQQLVERVGRGEAERAVAVALGSSPAKADQFTISASSPGTLSFSGSGTAQFNNSLGTNNSFQVGSATSLGVNAGERILGGNGNVASWLVI